MRENSAIDNKVKFLIYCLEIYKTAKHLSGNEVVSLFATYDVFNYIDKYYEALHTTSADYTIEDIDEYISSRR
jgi:hypothetical protein